MAPIRNRLTYNKNLSVPNNVFQIFSFSLGSPQPGSLWLIEIVSLFVDTDMLGATPATLNQFRLELTPDNGTVVSPAGAEGFVQAASLPIVKPIAVMSDDTIKVRGLVTNNSGVTQNPTLELFVQYLEDQAPDTTPRVGQLIPGDASPFTAV